MREVMKGAAVLEARVEEQGTFQCFLCSSEPPMLFRVAMAEWPSGGLECTSDVRANLRRRLVCDTCLRLFELKNLWATARIAGRVWYLGGYGPVPPVYTREKWFRYVERMRSPRRQKQGKRGDESP